VGSGFEWQDIPIELPAQLRKRLTGIFSIADFRFNAGVAELAI
jgi:hypothetical protein